jgi:hypothetical protein
MELYPRSRGPLEREIVGDALARQLEGDAELLVRGGFTRFAGRVRRAAQILRALRWKAPSFSGPPSGVPALLALPRPPRLPFTVRERVRTH